MRILLIGLLTLTSISSYACSCAEPEFTDTDTESAVLSFVENKLNVSTEKVLELKKTSRVGFLGVLGHALNAITTFGTSAEARSCGIDCATSVNEKSTFVVKYQSEDKICTQIVYVKMKSNMLRSGFKSKIKTKTRAICN